ncbi:hypothetical protein HK405_011025 [Cladochytrium tenue]|nr:hypothetical protein HK405_011025 [Cladochytrium tenue]
MSSESADLTVVFITGANSGIGFDTAVRLATDKSRKYAVVMGARSLEKGQKAVDEIKSRGNLTGSVHLIHIDVTSKQTIDAAAESVKALFGKLDVLINNAGIVKRGVGLEEDLRDTFATNSIGPVLVTDAFIPLLKESKDPRLIYVSSGLGSITLMADENYIYSKPFGLAYRMSKAALNMLAVYHHREHSTWGCKVWSLCPGFVVTNLTGEEDRENRVKQGALSSETSAETIAEVIQGLRDADVGKQIHNDGPEFNGGYKSIFPW